MDKRFFVVVTSGFDHLSAPRWLRVILLVVLPVLFGLPACAANDNNRAEVREFVAKLVRDDGFTSSEVKATLREAKYQQVIIDAISRPAERTLAWKAYRRIFVTPGRIAQGVAFWKSNEDALARVQSTYGVSPEIVVAIIGVETSYGRNTGSFQVLDALTTLAFDYPPRAPFFRDELEQYLLLTRDARIDPRTLKGSYAGAMGFPQFMPSSYRKFAVDFDGDGAKDLWRNPTDAIGSVANYFRGYDWLPGKPVAIQVIPAGAALDSLAGTDPEPKRRFSEVVGSVAPAGADGVSGVSGGEAGSAVPGDELVAILKFDADNGAEYWLGLHNFYVITRYNHSPMYAMAVFQLANALVAARSKPVVAPTGDESGATALQVPVTTEKQISETKHVQ